MGEGELKKKEKSEDEAEGFQVRFEVPHLYLHLRHTGSCCECWKQCEFSKTRFYIENELLYMF